jgi:hypothetical protein
VSRWIQTPLQRWASASASGPPFAVIASTLKWSRNALAACGTSVTAM